VEFGNARFQSGVDRYIAGGHGARGRWLIAADPNQLTGAGVEGNDTAGP